jgi:bifunctional DNA-binding transcriptional regulator/antitoxin component of YhaV-PrlF toxin-antitoxin module
MELMPVKFTLKAGQVNRSIKVTIPKEICEYLKIKAGNSLEMWAEGKQIIIEKKENSN